MYKMRPLRIEDFSFVANSYLKSYKGAPEARCLESSTYYADYTERLKKMVSAASVVVACSEEDEDQILGYVIGSAMGSHYVLDYVYVKFPFRCLGLGKALVKTIAPEFGDSLTAVTHQPKNWRLMKSKYNLVYLPTARKI